MAISRTHIRLYRIDRTIKAETTLQL